MNPGRIAACSIVVSSWGRALFKRSSTFLFAALGSLVFAVTARADDSTKLIEQMEDPKIKADSAWMMVSTALVLLMVPGLALFYGGMVRRKNVLATLMQSMVALAVLG